MEFLGHHISSLDVCPIASKVNTVSDFPRPMTITQLQQFMGLINYYHCFIPNLAHIMAPLYVTLARKPKTLLWETEQEETLTAAKKSLTVTMTLSFPICYAVWLWTLSLARLQMAACSPWDSSGES